MRVTDADRPIRNRVPGRPPRAGGLWHHIRDTVEEHRWPPDPATRAPWRGTELLGRLPLRITRLAGIPILFLHGIGRQPRVVGTEIQLTAILESDRHGADQSGRVVPIAAVRGQHTEAVISGMQIRCDLRPRDGVEVVTLQCEATVDPQLKRVVGRHFHLGGRHGPAAIEGKHTPKISRLRRSGRRRDCLPDTRSTAHEKSDTRAGHRLVRSAGHRQRRLLLHRYLRTVTVGRSALVSPDLAARCAGSSRRTADNHSGWANAAGGVPTTVAPAAISSWILSSRAGVIVSNAGNTSRRYDAPPGKTTRPSTTVAEARSVSGGQPSKL